MILNIWVWFAEEKEGIYAPNIAYLLCVYLLLSRYHHYTVADDSSGFCDCLLVD